MADLFVMPSTGEGFGIAFLEAMASGTPALGLDVAGARDALADGGLGILVSEEDDLPAAIARHLAIPKPNPDALSRLYARASVVGDIPLAGEHGIRSSFATRMTEHALPDRHLLVLEAGPGRAALLARPLGLSRAVRDPRLARCRGPLQADRHRRRLGRRPAVSDDGGVHGGVRPARQIAERRGRALSGHGVCRHAAVVSVFDDPRRSLEQPRRQRQSRRQGLFPAPDHPGLLRRRGARRFRDQPRDPLRADGVVRLLRRAGISRCCPPLSCWRCWRASARPS